MSENGADVSTATQLFRSFKGSDRRVAALITAATSRRRSASGSDLYRIVERDFWSSAASMK
jgi:hypothetical protein